jgi:hypothetical protein
MGHTVTNTLHYLKDAAGPRRAAAFSRGMLGLIPSAIETDSYEDAITFTEDAALP